MERQRFRETGVIELDELEKLGLLPPRERMMKGPVAILECPEPIPCNICTHFCPTKAIKKEHISAPLKIDWDKCIGCGICVAVCPGLAAFVVDISKSEADYVTLPYEFLPAPKAGDRVILLDRRGKAIGEGIIERVWEQNKTFVVTVRVPKGLGLEVRAIWIKK